MLALTLDVAVDDTSPVPAYYHVYEVLKGEIATSVPRARSSPPSGRWRSSSA